MFKDQREVVVYHSYCQREKKEMNALFLLIVIHLKSFTIQLWSF